MKDTKDLITEKYPLTRDHVHDYKWAVQYGRTYDVMDQDDIDFVNKEYKYTHWQTLTKWAHHLAYGFLSQFEDYWKDEIIASPAGWAKRCSEGAWGQRIEDPLARYLACSGFVDLMYKWKAEGLIPESDLNKIQF